MKKIKLILMGALMALTLAACAPTEIKSEDIPDNAKVNPAGLTPEMMTTEAVEKTGDPDAVPMEMVFLYQVGEDGKMTRETIDVETADLETIIGLLAENEILEEGTVAEGLDIEGGMKAGPGVDPSQVTEGDRIGTLKINQVPEDEKKLQSLVSTMIENFTLDKLQIVVDGDMILSGPEDGYFVMVDEGETVK